MVGVCLVSHGTAKQFCRAVAHHLPSHQQFFAFVTTTFQNFIFGHSVRYVLISHYAFNLYIFNDVKYFYVFICCLYILSGKMSQFICTFSILIYVLSWSLFYKFYSINSTSCCTHSLQIFSSSLYSLYFSLLMISYTVVNFERFMKQNIIIFLYE